MSARANSSGSILTRYAWTPLFLFSIVMLVVGIGGMVGPVREGSVISAYRAHEVTDQVLALRLRGSFVLGMVVFGISLILIPFRRGERWAWYVLWYYPVFFLLHVVAFGTLFPDGLFLLISAASLLVAYPRSSAGEAVAGAGG